jgi:hypothetical protein
MTRHPLPRHWLILLAEYQYRFVHGLQSFLRVRTVSLLHRAARAMLSRTQRLSSSRPLPLLPMRPSFILPQTPTLPASCTQTSLLLSSTPSPPTQSSLRSRTLRGPGPQTWLLSPAHQRPTLTAPSSCVTGSSTVGVATATACAFPREGSCVERCCRTSTPRPLSQDKTLSLAWRSVW